MKKTKLDTIIEAIIAILMIIMVITVSSAVFFRYILNSPLGWTEEIGRYSLAWITLLGTYLLFKRSEHMRIGIIFNKFNDRIKRKLIIIGNFFMIVFVTTFIWYGYHFAIKFANSYSPYLEIPMVYVYSIFVISGILINYFLVSETICIIMGKESQTISTIGNNVEK